MTSVFNQWHPVTHDFGLICAPLDQCETGYVTWLSEIVEKVSQRRLCTALGDHFASLAPLTIAKNKTLLLPTQSRWTAFFRNGISGSDPASAMPAMAARLNVVTMRICITADESAFPAVMWEVYEPASDPGKPATTRRSLCAANDGGRWTFVNYGEPFAFEKLERYEDSRIRNRFDAALLAEYAAHFGIPQLGEAMFESTEAIEGCLISVPKWPQAKTYSLDDVKAGMPWSR